LSKCIKIILIVIFVVYGLFAEPNSGKYVYPQEKTYKWLSVSGKWETRLDGKTSYLLETKGKYYEAGYSPLNNINSLITESAIPEYTSLTFNLEVLSAIKDPADILVVFAAKDLRQFYAFKFTGTMEKAAMVHFISSKINDTTRPPAQKWNFTVSELASKDFDLEYRKEHTVEIRVKDTKATLYVDDKKILQAEAPEALTGGRIGFSDRNALIKISDVKVYNGRKVVFEDNFAEDSIKRYKVTATRVSKEEMEKMRREKREEK